MRVAVVGATGALGGRIVARLAADGASLVVSGRSHDKLASLASEIGATAVAADLMDDHCAQSIVGGACEALGGLDAIVQAAGIVAFGSVEDLTDEVLDRLVRVNLVAPVRVTREALGRMDRPGTIVNVSAIVADMPTAGMAAYSATKAALSAFDTAVGRESRRNGIRVLDVRPPHLATGLENRAIAGEPPRLPEGRDPAEVVDLIVSAIADPHVRRIEMGA
jgi:cyclic-di-GMP-binding biofilm dispersal mediator protein